ncbi:MAG: CHASE2 domain-containing protein [Stenotrophomonas nitritireducens]|uniref:CHASE2 domain-containing protein n=1 Tax=Stenotrophomonas nitritireducens TaxID=83617 RepID=UPI001AD50767|nr:CHASE2 domain-containing protein [Stenotrophomonas nitritireducens]MBN8792308.1 CHASE2 domain-containing protein [Stenotrophomonas nitritireducens]MBN8796131.1 CHASE2 domain-containing protein [Stenotrophomonas nitritireducens]
MRAILLPWPQRLLLAGVLGGLAGWASQAHLFWQQDEHVYDQLVGGWDYTPDDSLAIVAIDERSLQQLGQWPWPRGTHARLLDRLHEAGARRVALDLMFPEPDRKDATQDEELAAAIKRSGNVVLPVLAASASDAAVPEELLPVPVLASAARTLAHTDIEVDGDGVARGLYLKAGVGSAYWPALGLALSGKDGPVPGLGDPAPETASPYQWRRDNYVRLRYAGRPGTFPQVSYIDVLEGRLPPGLLRDRRVIVGMTASGIAPRLLTPTSRESWMSGTEYQANVASMLLGGRVILPLPPGVQSGMVIALVALCALGMTQRRLSPLRVTAAALALPLLLSLVLLRGFDLWFAPVAAVAGVMLMLLAWGLWQMRYWRRQANRDPLTGLANRMRFEEALRLEYEAARRSGRPLSLVLIDLDNFKHYNDTFGHHVGDLVLQQTARMIGELARRPRDLAARFGGDEFALVLPDTSSEGAIQLIEALLVRVRQAGIAVGKGRQARISVTAGLGTVVPDADSLPSQLFRATDAALYQAKAAGRDGYQVAPAG